MPPTIKTRPSASRVAVCCERLEIMSPVLVKVPGDWAITLEMWLASPNKTSRRTKLSLNNPLDVFREAFTFPPFDERKFALFEVN